MKTLSTIFLTTLLCACGMSDYLGVGDTSTTKGKLRTCAYEEAVKKVQDGSAFTKTIQASADEISSTCIKKLALQSMGLDNEASQDAQHALQTLMNTYSKYNQ